MSGERDSGLIWLKDGRLPVQETQPRKYDPETHQFHIKIAEVPANDSGSGPVTRNPKSVPARDDLAAVSQIRNVWIVTIMNAIYSLPRAQPPAGCLDKEQWLTNEVAADAEIAAICTDKRKPHELEKRAVAIWEEIVRCQKYGTCEMQIDGRIYRPPGMTCNERIHAVLETIASCRCMALSVLDGSSYRGLVSAPAIRRGKFFHQVCGQVFELRGSEKMRQILGT
ncbi:hypothetical protein SMMN14_07586 [Sphaerulina musiva]